MEYKVVPSYTENIDDRVVTGLSSIFGNVDDGGDITHSGAFSKTLQERGSRIRHLWQHDVSAPPIAVIKDIREVGRDELPSNVRAEYPQAKGGLMVKREYLDTPRGNEVLAGIRSGAINEMSFGYDPLKKDMTMVDGKTVRNLREVRLWETSDVNFGMNPATRAAKSIFWELMTAISAGQDVTSLLQAGQNLTPQNLEQISQGIAMLLQLLCDADPDMANYMSYMSADVVAQMKRVFPHVQRIATAKGAIAYKATPKAEEGAAWDGPAQVSKANVDDLKVMCAWVDPDKADAKDGYKLPHHEAEGEHAVVWNGVKAAMGALLGARGGADIPDGERKAVYEHLSKHYGQFEKEPPDYKYVELALAVKDMRNLFTEGEFKEGRMISAANLDKLKQAIAALQTILDAAEPPDDDEESQKALTDALALRLMLTELDARFNQWG